MDEYSNYKNVLTSYHCFISAALKVSRSCGCKDRQILWLISQYTVYLYSELQCSDVHCISVQYSKLIAEGSIMTPSLGSLVPVPALHYTPVLHISMH